MEGVSNLIWARPETQHIPVQNHTHNIETSQVRHPPRKARDLQAWTTGRWNALQVVQPPPKIKHWSRINAPPVCKCGRPPAELEISQCTLWLRWEWV